MKQQRTEDEEADAAINYDPMMPHMDEGGTVGDFDVNTGDSDTVKGIPPPMPVHAPIDIASAVPPPAAPLQMPQAPAAPMANPMPGMPAGVTPDAWQQLLAQQTAQVNKYSPDQQFAQEQAGIKARTGLGAALSNGGARFADAIMQGVARAGNPGFEKQQTDQANQLAGEASGAIERARKGSMEQVEANQKIDMQDPQSPTSKAYQKAFSPIFAKMGYDPKAVMGMPASQINTVADLGVRYADAQTQMELKKAMIQVQTLTAQASIANNQSERRQSALKDLQATPWYSRMLHPGISGALEKEAGLDNSTPTPHGIPDLGSTFNGEKVTGVKKLN